jgi:hypothetical protein
VSPQAARNSANRVWNHLPGRRSDAHHGSHARALRLARHALDVTVQSGFFPVTSFERDPWLASIRDRDEYRRIIGPARERYLAADAAFQAVGGYRLVGLRPASNAAALR